MTKAPRSAPAFVVALAIAVSGVAVKAAPTRPDALADLRRQEAGLQDRIARLELDRLVARVDAAMPARPSRPVHADKLDRELAAYSY